MTEQRNLRDELERFDGTYPKSWKPKIGDIITGTIVRYTSGTTDFGEYPIVVIEEEDSHELRSVWLMHLVLREQFKKLRPKIGERVGIKRLPDSDKGYKRYALRVDREEPSVLDVDRFAPTGDVAPEDKAALLDDSSDDAGREDEAPPF